MATGMEWALKAVLQHLGMDPETVKSQIAGMGQIIVGAKAQQDRIEQKLDLILAHFGISQPDANVPALTNGQTNGREPEHH